MQKNLPIIIFTGFAVAAAGTLGAVLSHDKPWHWLEAEKASEVVPPVAVEKLEPQVAVVAPPKIEAPKAAVTIAPSFDAVRVEPTGEAVISGHATPGAEVVVKLAGAEVGRATTNAEGSFVVIPLKPLPQGAAALTLETTVDNVVVPSQEQVAIVVKPSLAPAIVAEITPDQPVTIAKTLEPAKSVELSAVDYDAEGNIQFQGRTAAGGTVRFYVDNAPVGETSADQNGQWQFKAETPIAVGEHILRADEVDATGKVLSRIEQPFLREDNQKVTANATPEPEAPKTVAAQPVAEVAEQPNRIVIQPGQNLWRISREVYGKGRLFTVIFEANKDRIKDPSKVYPGQILNAPKS